MYTQEQILDMYFERNQQAVSATSQMYGAPYAFPFLALQGMPQYRLRQD